MTIDELEKRLLALQIKVELLERQQKDILEALQKIAEKIGLDK